jgi:hypothetical protein
MRNFKTLGILCAGTALASIGAMTPAERQRGRYMRAPDHAADEFAAFEAAGDVEIGDSNAGTVEPPAPKPNRQQRRAAAPAATPTPSATPAPSPAAAPAGDDQGAKDGEDQDGEPGEEDEGEGEGEPEPKPKPKASDRIRELNRRAREAERALLSERSRIDALEAIIRGKGGLPAANPDGNSVDIGEAPDPTDAAKYPLGHLDDAYIEDKLEYLATKKAAGLADAGLQRQQAAEQAQRTREAQTELLTKVDTLADRGSELFDDFQTAVVDAGMKGEWDLSQPTFEAAHDATHGAQILYDLSKDKAEATRVAKLSPYQQLLFVQKRDTEIEAAKKPRTRPGAPTPPATTTRGATSRTTIKPDTDNLDDFERAWEVDAKR